MLELSLKHVQEGEEKARERYDDIKNRIKSWSKAKKSRRLKYAKWINTMKSTTSRYWGKEIPRINEKVEKLHTKFVKSEEEVKCLLQLKEKEQWARAMAKGSGPSRKRLKIEVPIYGEVQVDEDEKNAASLPPKFTLFKKLLMEEIKVQRDICNTKIRWNRKGQLVDEKGDVIWDPEDPQTDEEVVLQNNQNEVYDPITKTIDFRKLKATLIKNNPRVKMPKPRPAIEEAQILTRRTMTQAIATDFIALQKEYTNLTTSEKRGLRLGGLW